MSRAFTHEEFIDKLKTKNNHFDAIEILGKYINTKSKIQCKCKICGYEWKAIPEVLLNGNGCRKCGRIIAAEKTKIKHSDYLISFRERHIQQLNYQQNIAVVENLLLVIVLFAITLGSRHLLMKKIIQGVPIVIEYKET